MIVSYMAIHHDQEYQSQGSYEKARAEQVRHLAARHGVPVRDNPDGDTTYVEASISLQNLGNSTDPDTVLDAGDEALWGSYVEFLMALEDSNLGYLLHEVDKEAEKDLVEGLADTGDDSPSLKYVDVDYRVEAGA